ncbi:hypothetical protein ACOSP7_025690 [Xanthoceras sorbifolium]
MHNGLIALMANWTKGINRQLPPCKYLQSRKPTMKHTPSKQFHLRRKMKFPKRFSPLIHPRRSEGTRTSQLKHGHTVTTTDGIKTKLVIAPTQSISSTSKRRRKTKNSYYVIDQELSLDKIIMPLARQG